MSKRKQEIPHWAKMGHSRPVTRRELLAAGAIPFAAKLLMPQWINLMMGEKAQADEMTGTRNCPRPSQGWAPFIQLNLAGGAGLMANFVPHDVGRQMLPSYSLMGLGKAPALQYEFGNVPFAGGGVSNFIAGLKSTATMGTIDKTAFAAVCVTLKDDTVDNKLSIDGLLTHAGRVGALLPNLGVRANTPTGIGMQPALIVPPAPLIVKDFNTVVNSLGYAADIGQIMNDIQKRNLASLVQNLSKDQMQRLGVNDGVTEIRRVVECAGMTNTNNMTSTSNTGIDPRANAGISTLWNINATSPVDSKELVFSTMVYNVLNGNAGAAALELGGYDYHDGTRKTGNDKDKDAGEMVGRILETAAKMNVPVFLYLTSDGSVASTDSDLSTSPWVWDRGAASTTYMFYFNPSGRRGLVNGDYQVGHFTKGQVADETFVTGGNAELSAVAVFANYLAVNGKGDQFGTLTNDKLSRTDQEKVTKFMSS